LTKKQKTKSLNFRKSENSFFTPNNVRTKLVTVFASAGADGMRSSSGPAIVRRVAVAFALDAVRVWPAAEKLLSALHRASVPGGDDGGMNAVCLPTFGVAALLFCDPATGPRLAVSRPSRNISLKAR
jgi:hypothetical protein